MVAPGIGRAAGKTPGEPVLEAIQNRLSGAKRTFRSLEEPEFAWYFAGNIAFFMGMQMQFVLRGFLAYDLEDSAFALGLVSATIAAPFLFVAPFGGVVADRVNKRTLLIVTQSVSAAASVLIAVLILTDMIVFWHLLAVSLLTGVVFSFNMPARQALVPLLVPQHKMQNAISLQMGGMNFTRIIAPAVGGLLIAPLGIGWVYMVTFGLFALAVASEFHLPKEGLSRAKDDISTFKEDFIGGFVYIKNNKMVRTLLLAGTMLPLFGFPVQMLLPVFSEDVYGNGSIGLGMLAAATGVGGLIGTLYSANLDRIAEKGRIMLIGGSIMALFLIAFAASPFFILALVFLAAANVGQMLFMTTNNTAIQAGLPDRVRGRVMSVMMMSFGLMPLGTIPISALSDSIGVQWSIGLSSIALLLVIAIMFTFSRTVRTLRMEALEEASMSKVQAARLVAAGTITQEEADKLTGAIPMPMIDGKPAFDIPVPSTGPGAGTVPGRGASARARHE